MAPLKEKLFFAKILRTALEAPAFRVGAFSQQEPAMCYRARFASGLQSASKASVNNAPLGTRRPLVDTSQGAWLSA